MTVEQLNKICEIGKRKRISGDVLNVICESVGGDYLSILYVLNDID